MQKKCVMLQFNFKETQGRNNTFFKSLMMSYFELGKRTKIIFNFMFFNLDRKKITDLLSN